MENNNSVFSKLMSILFITMGIFLGIYAFFANATTRTVGSGSWDNSQYITSGFRDLGPTNDDIIKALYGSGNDGSIYTTGWDTYTSLSCIDHPMVVEYHSALPTLPLNAYTIYVIESGTYTTTTSIDMPECSALISSGIVTIESNGLGTTPVITFSTSGNILHNIAVDNTDGNGISIQDGSANITFKNVASYNNGNTDGYGIKIDSGSYTNLVDIDVHDNYYGIGGAGQNYFVTIKNILAQNNTKEGVRISLNRSTMDILVSSGNLTNGILVFNTEDTVLTNIDVHGNNGMGIQFANIDNLDFFTGLVYNNQQEGINVTAVINSTFNNIQSYQNTHNGIALYSSVDNIFTNIIANESINRRGIYVSASSGNTFSGITTYGNNIDGVHLRNSTGIIINNMTGNQNTGNGIYLGNSSYCTLHNVKLYDNDLQGLSINNSHYNTVSNIYAHHNIQSIVGVVGSHNNTFTNITGANSANEHGMYISGSSYTTMSGIRVSNNDKDGIYLLRSYFTTGTNITSYANGYGGIKIEGSTGNTINTVNAYTNTDYGIYLYLSTNNTLSNLNIHENPRYGMQLEDSNSNIFSHVIASGNALQGLYFIGSSFNTGTNISINNNGSHGLYLHSNSSNNVFTTGNIYDNGVMGIDIESYSTGNSFTNFNVYDNTDKGISIFMNSHNTLLSGVNIYSNTGRGLSIDGSYSTIGRNIRSRSNDVGLYMTNTSGNNFSNMYTYNNTGYGIHLSASHNNSFDGLTSSGNADKGIYSLNSNNNVISNSFISHNFGGISILGGTGNQLQNISIYNNTGSGISTNYTSGLILDALNIYNNFGNMPGILMQDATYSTIKNSHIVSTGIQKGIHINLGNNNIISGNTLTGGYGPISIEYSFNNNITNNTGDEIDMYNTTGNIIQHFGTGGYVYETHGSGLFLYTIYDAYTQSSNKISLTAEDSNIAILTGNILSIGSIFTTYFDDISIYNPLLEDSIYIEGTTSFTVSGASRDGTIYVPTTVPGGLKTANIAETGITAVSTILETIEVITGDTYLTMNGGTGTISYKILGGNTGQEITIFTSTNGEYRSTNTPNNNCILDDDLICEFDFNGSFKLFAFGIPTNLSFTGYTFPGDIIENGHYYTTGGYILYTGDYISGATLDRNLYTGGDYITSNGLHQFILTDQGNNSIGITFTIDTDVPSVTLTSPANATTLLTGTNISFQRTGSDIYSSIDSYRLYLNNGSTTQSFFSTSTGYTIPSLDNGSYTRRVVATDLAGNTGASTIRTLGINAPLTGSAIFTGSHLIQQGSVRYTKADATFALWANQPCTYTLTGDSITTRSRAYAPGTIVSRPLLGSDGSKTIYITFTTGTQAVSMVKTIMLDTIANPPTLVSPTSGSILSGAFTLTWNHPTTAEAPAISGYRYYFSTTGTFATILHSGFVAYPANSVTIPGISTTGILYRYVATIDTLGNAGGSSGQLLVNSYSYTGADTLPHQFIFTDEDDADLDTIYASNTITITGMTNGVPVLASIDKGALYINDSFAGSTGYVQSGSTVKIELVSSDDYNETVSSILNIGGVTDTFSVTTMDEDEDTDYDDIETDLSTTEKLMIIAIFESLKDLYAGDKEVEFLNTLMVMLDNKMDDYNSSDEEYDGLKYLADLIEQYYDDADFGEDVDTAPRIVNGVYTAPNGKKYTITYDSSKQWFTSTNFVVPKYFPTLDTLKYIIDINNPVGSQFLNAKPIIARWKNAAIDGTRQTSPYTAPNKKAFYFFKTIDGRYSSYTFTTERYFDSLDGVKQFIFDSNKK